METYQIIAIILVILVSIALIIWKWKQQQQQQKLSSDWSDLTPAIPPQNQA